MYLLSVETKISTAHRLRDYNGPCARIHGHNWKIRLEVQSAIADEKGIVLDFTTLEHYLHQVTGPFDHQLMNDVSPFDVMNPTAENLAKYIYDRVEKLLPDQIKMKKVNVWETDRYMVSYEGKQ
jgi:6-pyruvoyltetrahydropterin/6-carboxytetrahydropterin synthase